MSMSLLHCEITVSSFVTYFNQETARCVATLPLMVLSEGSVVQLHEGACKKLMDSYGPHVLDVDVVFTSFTCFTKLLLYHQLSTTTSCTCANSAANATN